MQYVIALCLLPYLRFTPMNSDTQPHAMLALIAAIVLAAIATGKLKLYPLTVLSALFFLLLGIGSGELVQGISLAFLPIGTDFISRQSTEKILQGTKIAVVVLLLGAVLNVVAEGVLAQIVSNFRTGGSRGMNSFASEASFLGLLGLACGLILHTLRARWYWFWLSGLLTLLSGSATAVFPFALMVVLIYIKGWRLLFVPAMVFGLSSGIQYAAQTETRFGSLARTITESPELILLDESFSNRIIRSAGPIIVSYENDFYPQGLNADFELGLRSLSDRADYSVDRLTNPASVFIYGLGFLSLPFLVLYLYNSRGPAELWMVLLFFSIVNISTATPYLWILYALPWILKRQGRRKQALPMSPEEGIAVA